MAIKPVPLQVVFQGGGAKLCVLMAVCEVLSQYQRDGRVEVTRVAGSSAGAIAAVMLASGLPISTYKERLKRLGTERLALLGENKLIGGIQILRGKPFFSKFRLDEVFETLITSDNGPKYVRDLSTNPDRLPQLYYTDLYTLASRVASEDDAISKALAKSCRFPLAFSGFNSDDDHVDGGLAMNLPVDNLKRNEALMGNVIAISFAEKFVSPPKKSLLTYAQRLFSASIQSGVTRSILFLGRQNVFEAETDIGTFEFEKALGDGLGKDYNAAKDQFKLWLDIWLKDHGPIQQSQPEPGYPFNLNRPVVTTTPWRPAIIHELNSRVENDPCIHASTVSEHDIAVLDANGEFTGRYHSRCVMRFRITRPTNVLQYTFQVGKEGKFNGAGYAVTDSSLTPLNFIPHVQQLPVSRDGAQTYRVFFQFDSALTPDTPGQPFLLQYEYEADDPFPELGNGMEALILGSRQGPADKVTIVVAFPRARLDGKFNHRDVSVIDDQKLAILGYLAVKPQLVSSLELESARCYELLQTSLFGDPALYRMVGREGQNIKQNQKLGLVIEPG